MELATQFTPSTSPVLEDAGSLKQIFEKYRGLCNHASTSP